MKLRLFSAFLLFSGIISAQTQLYVSPAGNDANPGTLTLPFQTIQYAINAATPGTTVYLMGGTYYELVSCSVQGISGNPVTLTNYNNQNAVISAPANDSCCPLLDIHNANYFTVSGIEFSNYAANYAIGISVNGSSTHIQILNNTIHDIHFSTDSIVSASPALNAQPVLISGDDAINAITDITISGNEIYHCRTGYSEALAVNGNVNGFIITGNKVHDNTNIGIDLIGHEGTCSDPLLDQARNGTVRWNKVWNCISDYATSAGIYADGARNCVIENNTCYSNGWGIEIGCESIGDSASGIIVRNNLVYQNFEGGIAFGGYDYPTGSGKITNCSINNNTVVENSMAAVATAEIVISYCESTSFTNNIVYSNNVLFPFVSAPQQISGLHLDYNLYYSPMGVYLYADPWGFNTLSSWNGFTSFDAHSIITDPLFVNLSGQNYHLISTSPAIDRGDSLYVAAPGETDLDTMNRIQSGRVDIGADEYGTAVGIPFIAQKDEMYIVHDASTGVLTVMLSHPARGNGHVAIYNMEGKVVSSTMIFNGARSAVLLTSGLSSGTYLVHTTVIDAQAVKFVK